MIWICLKSESSEGLIYGEKLGIRCMGDTGSLLQSACAHTRK